MDALPLNRPSATLGTANAVLRARARQHYVKDYAGPFSIKSVTEGTVAWKIGGRALLVNRDSFLVLQQGEPYSMEIDERRAVSTLCVFFRDGFVESVCGSMVAQELDAGPAPVGMLARLHARDERVLPGMNALAGHLPDYLQLATDLLLLNEEVRRRVRMMPARRASTREELFRRVRRGQEFLHAGACEDFDLEQVARAACLSPYHFHRAFRQVFAKTPHQYRTELRLAKARRLLEGGEQSVTEVAAAVGFESLPSFSTLFRRSFGVPPAAVRKLRKFR